jgi:ribosomal peptide maturation radical SAM protein 1
MTDVLLVSMPFGTVFCPSLGLSLLSASLAKEPISVAVRYFTIRFAEIVGQVTYEHIAVKGPYVQQELAGEWIFSHALIEQTKDDVERYIDEVLVKRQGQMAGRPVRQRDIRTILRVRRRVLAFLDECLDEIVRINPRIVGFTSVFQQHVASLALARRLKDVLPETFVVFGGANCEGPMGAETLRQFPFVDAVVSGEGDLVVPDLVRRVLNGESVSGLPGVRSRDRLAQEFLFGNFSNAPSVQRMDDLPYPDYAEYMAQFNASRLGREWLPFVLAETSRGCWWGQRKHCTFCGLNGSTMTYRSKSPARALDELVWLSSRYPGSEIQVVDNILDLGYFKTLLPELAARGLHFDLFYETKSNLKKDQVRLLRAAGVSSIQPGIESFSDAVLKLTEKGVSAIQNVQLLKWCKEIGVEVLWNFLWGFPGEPPAEYHRMAGLVPALSHLAPPSVISRLRLDRFSPNFNESERLGFHDVKPLRSYHYVYGLPESALANLAYFFHYRYREPQTPEVYVAPLIRALRRWQRLHAQADLLAVDTGECLLLWDLRPDVKAAANRPLTVLEGLDRQLYRACDSATHVDHLVATANAEGGTFITAAEVARRLAPLVAADLMMQSGGRYLSLAIPLGEYRPSPPVVDRFYRVAKQLSGYRNNGALVLPRDRLREMSLTKREALSLRLRPAAARRRNGWHLTLSPDQFALTCHGDLIISQHQ